jgi:hypothetical protein
MKNNALAMHDKIRKLSFTIDSVQMSYGLHIFRLNFTQIDNIFKVTTAATRLHGGRILRFPGSVPWRLFFFIGVRHAF